MFRTDMEMVGLEEKEEKWKRRRTYPKEGVVRLVLGAGPYLVRGRTRGMEAARQERCSAKGGTAVRGRWRQRKERDGREEKRKGKAREREEERGIRSGEERERDTGGLKPDLAAVNAFWRPPDLGTAWPHQFGTGRTCLS